MKVFTSVKELRAELDRTEQSGIGFVPTMGALHAGHRSLVERARRENATVVVSVFVNPTQFNDKNDLRHYPRTPEADLNYVGSITIDEALMEAANVIEGEKVQIMDINNGERFETYTIKGERNSGCVCLNGAAARKVQVGDVIIIASYALMDFEDAKQFRPWIVFPDTATNRLVK